MSFSVLLRPAREQLNRLSDRKPWKRKNASTRIAPHAQQYKNDEHEAADCRAICCKSSFSARCRSIRNSPAGTKLTGLRAVWIFLYAAVLNHGVTF
jgi:hypothetical protein